MFSLFSLFWKDPSKLLKEATAKKKSGNIEGAVESLRKAYKAISRSPTDYTINTFLRLPLYLQQAGNGDEAWSEFNRLLLHGYPNQPQTRELIPMDHSAIYDKMRLFLQRENRPKESVKFGVFCHLSWGLGLYYQGRKKELRSHISKSTIESMLEALSKKAKKRDALSDLTESLFRHLEKFPNVDLADIGKEVDSIMLS